MEDGIVAQWLPSHATLHLRYLNPFQELACIQESGIEIPHSVYFKVYKQMSYYSELY